jgi:hypothetical protein
MHFLPCGRFRYGKLLRYQAEGSMANGVIPEKGTPPVTARSHQEKVFSPEGTVEILQHVCGPHLCYP